MLYLKTSTANAPRGNVYRLRGAHTSRPSSASPQEHGQSRRDRWESGLANLILGVSGMMISLIGFWAVISMLRLGAGLGGWLTGGLSQ